MQYAIEHWGLAARDTGALKDWYVAVLGAEAVWNNGAIPTAWFVRLPGGPVLEIYPAARSVADTTDNGVAGWRHLALRVADLPAAVAILTARGVVFNEPVKPAGGGGRVRFFTDPEGNLLHLVERPADAILTPLLP